MDAGKNEQGYALLTVLVMFVIFMSLGMTIFAHSYNSTKQNNSIEDDSQAVALAEMGISYFQAAVNNAYISNQPAVYDQVMAIMLADFEKKKGRPEGFYTDQAIALMADSLQTDLDGVEQAIAMEDQPDASFSIKNLVIEQHSKGIRIVYDSEGKEGEQEAELGAKLDIPISGVDPTGHPGPGSGEGGPPYVLPDFSVIPYPEGVSAYCQSPRSLNVDCQEILINGSRNYTANYNRLSGKTIYSTGSLVMGGNGNNMESIELHTDGSFSIDKNMNSLTASILEVKGSATFDGHLELWQDTGAFVGSSLKVMKHLDLNESSLYVGGSAAIGNQLNINENSKMCVAGNLSAKSINLKGKLYIKGTIQGRISGSPSYVNDQQFIEACGREAESGQPQLTIDWGKLINNIEYTY